MSQSLRRSPGTPGVSLSVVDGRDQASSDSPLPQQSNGESSDMARFRELLFGNDLRDYERRLAALEEQQTAALEQLRAEQQARFDQIESLLRSELTRLSRAQRRDREERSSSVQQLSDRLDRLAQELTQALGAHVAALSDGLAEESRARESALLDQAGSLQAALDARVKVLESELNEERARLQQVKADRDELAQLFGEVAQRLNRQLELP